MKKVFRKRPKKRRHLFPLGISIYRDEYFFAKLEWFLYKLFGKKRDIPCGRKKNEKYLCCCQPLKEDRIYYNSDRTKAYCKCCGSIRLICSSPIKSIDEIMEYGI